MMLTEKFILIMTFIGSFFKDPNYSAIEQKHVELNLFYTKIKLLE